MTKSRSNFAVAAMVAVALIAIYAMRGRDGSEPSVRGNFDYYALVLGWAPTYCAGEGHSRDDAECNASAARAFVLHGLWPQYETGWPENCHMATKPWVSSEVIAEMRDIMPSKNLVIHEYRAHGTCSGLDPPQYFGIARKLYDRITVPPELKAPGAELVLSAEEIERAFMSANPWLKPDMISITCRKGKLLDIRVCFRRDLTARNCGANEDQGKLCRTREIIVPPVAR
jgi:ribonuclease T2